MNTSSDENKNRLRELELENLRLRAELEARKAGSTTTRTLGKMFTSSTSRIIAGKRLKSSVKNLLNELPGQPTKNSLADVLTHLVLRLTRIGTFAIFAALAPLFIMLVQTYILDMQNEKLDKQNDLLGRQNSRLDQQINLEEGNRRSSLVFFMSNIMDRIEDELRNNPGRQLSEPLIGRIVSLSQALRPYRYLENDKLTERQLSPERGQLLFSLINSDLDSETYDKIFSRANFSYADLQEANFSGAYLKGARLAHSYFFNANFNRADLRNADLSNAYLRESSFCNTKMDGANLERANLTYSHMENISIVGGNLAFADLQEIHLDGDFRESNLEGVKVKNARVDIVDLEGCIFNSLSWIDSLEHYNFEKLKMLRDHYDPAMQVDRNGEHPDTSYYLVTDQNSVIKKAMICNRSVRAIVDESPEVINWQRTADESNRSMSIRLVSDPFGIEELGVKKDSVFRYEATIEENSMVSRKRYLYFDPKQLQLALVSETGDLVREFTTRPKSLNGFRTTCQMNVRLGVQD